MKKILIGFIAASIVLLHACKKEKPNNPEPLLSSVIVVNAISNGGPLYVNRYAGGLVYSKQADSLNYQAGHEYGVPNGSLPLTVVYSRDTTKKVFSGNLNLMPLKAYSLYITGNVAKTDTLFKAETNFPRYVDSAVAVRVINLSIGGPAINVTLGSTPTINEFSGLGYKAQSPFKKYPLTSAIASNGLSFNVTDASTGAVLATYTLPQYSFNYPPTPTTETARFKAITLVVSGDINAVPFGANAYSIFLVANY